MNFLGIRQVSKEINSASGADQTACPQRGGYGHQPVFFFFFLMTGWWYKMDVPCFFTCSRPVVLSLMSSGRRMNILSSRFTYGNSIILKFIFSMMRTGNVALMYIISTGLVFLCKLFIRKKWLLEKKRMTMTPCSGGRRNFCKQLL